MRLPIYQVDAFASAVFKGNPAAVCVLDEWLDASLMQSIALENNLSETAFLVRERGGRYGIRWFTPASEVDLCGHATLASAFVLFEYIAPEMREVTFSSKSGDLFVRLGDDGVLWMVFPSHVPVSSDPPPGLVEALGRAPREVYAAGPAHYLVVYDAESDVLAIAPDMARLRGLPRYGTIVTARGAGETDFVSRFFAPGAGVDEDPVTGSAHCALTPYWAKRLGRTVLRAAQLSARGGEILCEDQGEKVLLGGRVARYLTGNIEV